MLFLSRAMFCVKLSVTQLRIFRVCLPQEQAPRPEQFMSCTAASTSRGFSLVLVARRSQTAQLHITGTRETVPPQDPCQGRGNAATLKRLRKNLISIPDPNCTSLVSVQQNHFCPHGAVRRAETALHCLCSLFNSFGMFFR